MAKLITETYGPSRLITAELADDATLTAILTQATGQSSSQRDSLEALERIMGFLDPEQESPLLYLQEIERRLRQGVVVAPSGTPRLFVSDPVRPGYGATAAALDANDAYGDRFQIAVPERGRIVSIKVIDQDDVIAASTLTLHIFKAEFVAAASDAAFTISAADALNWVVSQAVSTMTDLGSARGLEVVDVNSDYSAPYGYLWCQLSTTGTPTPTSGNMPRVQLFILPLV